MNKAAWKSMPRQLWCLSDEYQNLRTRELKIRLGMRDPIQKKRPAGVRAPGPAVFPQLPKVPHRGQAGSSTEPVQEMREVDGSIRRYAAAVVGAVVGEAGAVVMGETDATQPRDAAEGAFPRARAHGGMLRGGGAKESAAAAGTGCCGRGRQESTAPVQWDAVTFPAPAPPPVQWDAVTFPAPAPPTFPAPAPPMMRSRTPSPPQSWKRWIRKPCTMVAEVEDSEPVRVLVREDLYRDGWINVWDRGSFYLMPVDSSMPPEGLLDLMCQRGGVAVKRPVRLLIL